MLDKAQRTIPTFTHLTAHHDLHPSDPRETMVVVLEGDLHVVTLVLPEGALFFQRLVDLCFGVIPTAIPITTKQPDELELPF